ncbi:hypothetical protein BDN72DRAFT_838733 [Pluteus cervinus]|uniref:Uncharacterized protein n=1 Tax=Pluteus cervinus TaxID=181527 RepID=A0ACD3AXM0_9AGAR|nr:hypothetical protein BDN72DRAFT_838733 [Pluteus cervinus]
MAGLEKDSDSGAGTGGVNINLACALASFGWFEVLTGAGVERARRMMTRTSLPKGRGCLRKESLEGRGLYTLEEGFGRILSLFGKASSPGNDIIDLS